MIDNIYAFAETIRAAGLEPPERIEPGRFHRFPGIGKRNDNTAGWCKLFDDGMGGIYGDKSTELSEVWQAKREQPLTKPEREAFRRQVEEARKQAEEQRRQEQEQAATKARQRWEAAPLASRAHPYLVKKHIKPHGTRQEGDKLLIPLRDESGQVWALQTIGPDGGKLFSPAGCRIKGLYFSIGQPAPGGPVCPVEGFATGAAIHEGTGHPVACAMTAGNLEAVARIIKGKLPGHQIVVCADDDSRPDTEKNPGIEAATKAALAVGGVVAVPGLGRKADFWDLLNERGADAVRQAIEEARPVQDDQSKIVGAGANQGQPPAGDQERGHSWPEPLPLIVHEQAAPYPLDALPETIGAAVREVVGFVQCPVALGACSALSVVSTVGQGLADVRRAAKLEGPTSLFLLAVADSGERKTTVDGFFSKPVQQWEAERAEAAKPELNRFRSEDEAWAAKKSGLLTALRDAAKLIKSTGSLEQNLIDLEADKPEPPKVPRLLYGDATPEALAHRLAHEWPVGGVLSSEAGAVFGSHGMKSDSAMRNMAMLNSLWGAEPLTVDRRAENGSFTLRGARLTMGLAVQSETVRAFLDGSKGLARGIGWLARFLVAWPESTQGGRMFKEPPEHWPCLAKFHRRLGALLDHPLVFNDRGELEPETLELSPEAKAVWVAFHDDVEAELKPGRDMAEARDVASKAADNAARLAGLFYLFENDPGGTIGADHMRRAAAVAGWHLYEARRFLGEIALPVQLSSAAKLDAWLLEHCWQNRVEEISTRDAQRLGPNCTREKSTLDGALQELAEAGRVQIVESKRRRLVKVNPALLGG
jgi:putative DNA primase/helicase